MRFARIGLATCAHYPNLAPSDRLAATRLRDRGSEVVPLVWTEVAREQIDCDLVVIRSVWDYHLNVEGFLRWIDLIAERAMVLNSPGTIHWNCDKRYLLELQRAGVPVPRMVLLEQGSQLELRQILGECGFESAVVKPVVSASAFQTYLVDRDNADVVQQRAGELLASRSLLVQEFVPEITTRGEWSLMFFGSEYSHAVRKLPKAGDFRVQAEHGGEHIAEPPPADLGNLATRVVETFAQQTLYARVDIVEAGAGPLLMELELIDPELYLAEHAQAPERMITALERLVG